MAFVPRAPASSRGNSGRFNLMCLEESESYFEDFIAIYYPNTESDAQSLRFKQKGRLKLCSHSLIFDPEDSITPITKFPFRDTQRIHKWRLPLLGPFANLKTEIFVIACSQVVTMKEQNQDAPYQFIKTPAPVEHRFSLNYVGLDKFLPRVAELHNASQLRPAQTEAALKAIVGSRESAVSFDTSWLEDLTESPLTELTVSRVTPLVLDPGKLMITDKRVYFQAFSPTDAHPVKKWHLNNVVRVLRRRHMLRHVGIEIYIRDGIESSSLFLAFRSSRDRELVMDLFEHTLKLPHLLSETRTDMTQRWLAGQVSNYDYLVYLNEVAGRTYNDLTQYPVFPWVVADYTSAALDLADPSSFRDLSKPIGALHEPRLRMFEERFREMPDDPNMPKFFYGTHYSTPGYVLYYLVRQAADCMLRLQRGRFDSPDRLFCSIAETWRGVNENSSDLKELIPEFYRPECYELLVNSQHLEFGSTQSGEKVGDVVLPPWAQGSPHVFLATLREALECNYVSSHLHQWVNLIFGYQQRGEEAIRAKNLFHHITYEGTVDMDSIQDPVERAGIEVQIREFGQTPSQIFTQPHPVKGFTPYPEAPPSGLHTPGPGLAPAVTSTSSAPDRGFARESASKPPVDALAQLRLGGTPTTAGEGVSRTPGPAASPVEDSAGHSLSAHQPSVADIGRVYSIPPQVVPLEALLGNIGSSEGGHQLKHEVADTPNAPDQADAAAEPGDTPSTVASAANPQEFTCIVDQRVHRDVVMSLCVPADVNTIYSVSQDAHLKMYSIEDARQLRSTNLCDLALSGCRVTRDGRHIVCSAWDNRIYVYSLDYGTVTHKLHAHDDAVSCLSLRGSKLLTASWDSVVRIWNCSESGVVGKVPVAEFLDHDAEVRSADIDAEVGQGGHSFRRDALLRSEVGRVAAAGGSDGMIVVWDLTRLDTGGLTSFSHAPRPHDDAVTGLSFSPDGSRFATTSLDHTLRVTDTRSGGVVSALDAGEPLHCVATDDRGKYVIAGTESGEVLIWDSVMNKEVTRLVPHRKKSAARTSSGFGLSRYGSPHATATGKGHVSALYVTSCDPDVASSTIIGDTPSPETVALADTGLGHICAGYGDGSVRVWGWK